MTERTTCSRSCVADAFGQLCQPGVIGTRTIVSRDEALVAFRERLRVGQDRSPFLLAAPVERDQFGVNVIDAEALEDQGRASDIVEGTVEEPDNRPRGCYQGSEGGGGHVKGVAGVVPFGDHHREAGRVREDRQEGKVALIFPDPMTGFFTCDE